MSNQSPAEIAHFETEKPVDAEFDCVSCGCCCYSKVKNYVQVFPHDTARLGPARTAELVAAAVGEIPATIGRASEPERFMKMTNGRCAALRIEGKRFTCSVYEDRPTLCRALEPGSESCQLARARLGIGPQL